MAASMAIDRTAAAAGQQQTDRLLTTCEYRQLFVTMWPNASNRPSKHHACKLQNRTAILTE
jgi:hypothetical protein